MSEVAADATRLWRTHGGPQGEVEIQTFATGGNNRVLLLKTPNGAAKAVVKSYFQDGGRKRLDAESQFLNYAAQVGIKAVPRVIAVDNEALLGLYQFSDGKKLNSDQIKENHIVEAANFISNLNKPSSTKNLANAAEACFSIADHLTLVRGRLDRLSSIPSAEEADKRAAALVKELGSYWQSLHKTIETRAHSPEKPIAMHERVISPSDFGFHNALVDKNDRLTFVDFEYAGWDDIAKLTADFFFQPAVPISSSFFENFMERITDEMPNKNATQARIRLLRPIFGVKWCCIMLNCFLPEKAARGRFANPARDEALYKNTQLAKAEKTFQTLMETKWHI